MAYQTKVELASDTTIKLGGRQENGTPNPTSVEGYFLGTRITPDTGYGPGKLHFFQTEVGVVGVWGKTRLNSLLTPDLAGQMCLVTFKGMGPKQKGKSPAFLYSLQHDPANTIDVTSLAAAETATTDVDASDYERDMDLEEPADEIVPVRPTAPKAKAAVPAAKSQAAVQALLSAKR